MAGDPTNRYHRCCCQQNYFQLPPKVPHKCPVCEGRGNVPRGFYDQNSQFAVAPTTTIDTPENCRACQSAGIIWGE